MTSAIASRLIEIADLGPQLADHEKQLKKRRGDLDRRCGSLRRDGKPIPPELLAEQRQVREDFKALDDRRKQLLDELAQFRPDLSERQSALRSRTHACKLGLVATREEYDAALVELRTAQATLDRACNWIDGTTPRAGEHAELIASIEASCHDPLSFDSDDW